MITFWALAILLVAIALWLVLRPLLRRDGGVHPAARKLALVDIFKQQLAELDADLASGTLAPEHYERSRIELEKRLLEETEGGTPARAPVPSAGARRFVLPVAVGLFVPLFAFGLYLIVGQPQRLSDRAPTAAADSTNASHPTNQEQIETMVARLAARLKEHDQDADGWAMLGRSYGLLGRFSDGAAAFARADALRPGDAQLLADYADTLAMAQGKHFDGEPAALIKRALAADPNNMKAQALAASAAFAAGAYPEAVNSWQKLLQRVPPESEMAAKLNASIADARQRGGLKETPPVAAARTSGNAAPAASGSAPVRASAASASAPIDASAASERVPAQTAGTQVKGRVRLIAELADKAAPTDTVFVIARAVGGPAMPLAVIKRQVKDLPMDFILDDTMAMSPEAKLSSFKLVDIGARVSRSGGVTTRSGDLVSQPVRATVGGPGVEVAIQGLVR